MPHSTRVPTKGPPPTQGQAHARHVLRCTARAAWGPHPESLSRSRKLAGPASLALVAGRTHHSLPRSPQHVPPGPYEHLLEKVTARDEICALDQPELPAPARALSNPPSAGPALPPSLRATSSGDSRPGPAPGLLAAPPQQLIGPLKPCQGRLLRRQAHLWPLSDRHLNTRAWEGARAHTGYP